VLRRPKFLRGPSRLHGSDLAWSIGFIVPYAILFAAFVIYPMGYALRMGSDLALYAALLTDPRYLRAAINTVLFVGLVVNVEMPRTLTAPRLSTLRLCDGAVARQPLRHQHADRRDLGVR